MRSEGLSEAFIADFLWKVNLVREGETGIVDWSSVGDLDPSKDELTFEEIQKNYPLNKTSLSKLVVIKLNGGLGTSMGLEKAKSLIPIKGGQSFLAVIAKQIEYIRSTYGVEVPLLFMDSYNTQEDSQVELKKVGFHQKVGSTFLQHKVPRLVRETLEPLTASSSKEEWCPPGHGDIYFTLLETGLLDELIEQGFEVAFLSNGDNLGATVDPHIVEFFLKENLDFAMEMTPKTLADKKGGAIYRKTVGGKFLHFELLETAQVPKENEHEFSGLGKFRTFSTNNLWINLKSLKQRLKEGNFQLSLIVNPKKVADKEIYQLETAMGSAVGKFPKFKGIIIPRDRFAPVKKTEDYLIRRSDAYTLNKDYSLTMDEKRKKAGIGEMLVELDEVFYKKIGDFDGLFSIYPSLVYCESLRVEGKVFFDAPLECRGKVSIIGPKDGLGKVSEMKERFLENTEYRF